MREKTVAAVTAKLPENRYITNLFGKRVLRTKQCRTCGEEKPITAFYLQSFKFSKYADEVRDDCKYCYDANIKMQKLKREGKLPYDGCTLEKFLGE